MSRRSRNGGPACFAGPLLLFVAVLATGTSAPSPALALDWIPPRPFTAILPSATLAPSSSHALALTIRANGPGASLVWDATCAGMFACSIQPSSGIVAVPSNGTAVLPITVTLPDTALGAVSLTVTLSFEQGGGIAAKAGASVQAATGGRPEIKPVPSTMSGSAGSAGSVAFQIHSLIGGSEELVITAGRFNPDPNNVGTHFAWGSPLSTVVLAGGATTTVSVPVTLSANAYAGNLNSVQMSVTSNGGISNALGNALVSAASPGSLPTACVPVGLTPFSTAAAGRDGPASLAARGYWLTPNGLEGVRVTRVASSDSIGMTDANGDGGDDRVIGTIRIPSYAAALSVIPNFVTAHAETLDVGLLAAGRAGLMLLDLRMIEDPTFGSWEDFFDSDMNGVDDRILRTIPTPGFATDAAWFRSTSGRIVALVADADSGSIPVSVDYNPAATVAGTGAGIVAIDVGAALDSLGGNPYAAGTLATPGSALDLEVRDGGGSAEVAVADGAGGVAVYGLSTAGGIPATVTFTLRGTTALSSAWGTPYARDLAWVSNTRDSLYLSVAAGAGGVQLIRAPRAVAPSLVLAQQTSAPAIGVAGTWTGTIGVTMGVGGVALMRLPVASELNKIGPGAPPPYAAPVVVAQGAPWGVSGPLQVAAHQGGMSASTAACFEATAGPLPDLFVSDGVRLLVLRPGTATVTAVEVTESPLPRGTGRLRAVPNPSSGVVTFEARVPGAAGPGHVLEIGIYDVQGRLVRTLRAQARDEIAPAVWDGRDASGTPVASGRYWARLRRGMAGGTAGGDAAIGAAPIVILR